MIRGYWIRGDSATPFALDAKTLAGHLLLLQVCELKWEGGRLEVHLTTEQEYALTNEELAPWIQENLGVRIQGCCG